MELVSRCAAEPSTSSRTGCGCRKPVRGGGAGDRGDEEGRRAAKDSVKLGAAVVGGYLLGRTKKGKTAIGLALWLSGKRMDNSREAFMRLATSPELGKLTAQVRGPRRPWRKAAGDAHLRGHRHRAARRRNALPLAFVLFSLGQRTRSPGCRAPRAGWHRPPGSRRIRCRGWIAGGRRRTEGRSSRRCEPS